MPRSKTFKRMWARTSSSAAWPICEKTGCAELELAVGLVLCAATQIEQEASEIRVGCLWVDSAVAVHSIMDRHSQADHRITHRMRSCIGIRLYQLISVIKLKAIAPKLR